MQRSLFSVVRAIGAAPLSLTAFLSAGPAWSQAHDEVLDVYFVPRIQIGAVSVDDDFVFQAGAGFDATVTAPGQPWGVAVSYLSNFAEGSFTEEVPIVVNGGADVDFVSDDRDFNFVRHEFAASIERQIPTSAFTNIFGVRGIYRVLDQDSGAFGQPKEDQEQISAFAEYGIRFFTFVSDKEEDAFVAEVVVGAGLQSFEVKAGEQVTQRTEAALLAEASFGYSHWFTEDLNAGVRFRVLGNDVINETPADNELLMGFELNGSYRF